MRENRKVGMYFVLGTFDEKKHKGRAIIVLRKKSQVLLRGNLLLNELGSVWLKVVYGNGMLNDGVYKTKSDLKAAFKDFTEQPLLEYIYG